MDSSINPDSSDSISFSSGSSENIDASSHSMVSMRTEDHNELYDHRQHPDFENTNPNSNTGPIMENIIIKDDRHGASQSNPITKTINNLAELKNKSAENFKSDGSHNNNISVETNDPNSSTKNKNRRIAPHRRASWHSNMAPHPSTLSTVISLDQPDPVIEAAEQAAENAVTNDVINSNEINSHMRPSKLAHWIHDDNSNSAFSSSHWNTMFQSEKRPASPNVSYGANYFANPNIPRDSSIKRPRRLSKTQSISEMKSANNLLNKRRTRTNSTTSLKNDHPNNINKNLSIQLTKTKSINENSDTTNNNNNKNKLSGNNNNNNDNNLNQKITRGSYDSDDSQGSRESQETEEDVWFPMEPQLHLRVNGIDFDELEEFAQQTRQLNNEYFVNLNNDNNTNHDKFSNYNNNTSNQSDIANVVSTTSGSSPRSSAALKYTPRTSAQQPLSLSDSTMSPTPLIEKSKTSSLEDEKIDANVPGVSFGANIKIEGELNEKTYNPQYFMPGNTNASIGDTGIYGNDNNASNNYNTNKNYMNGNNYSSTNINAGNYNTCNYVSANSNNNNFIIPNRFSFFCSDSEETIHTTDIASLVNPGQTFYDLFRGGEPTWWLDCSCPTDDEMRCIAKAFGIHPLTAEDIRIQETREKVELFKQYYFVCFHTFENDKESEDFLEPINVYLVVFRTGMLSFHFGPISHSANVRRRVRQLRDYVDVNSDWLCYALIDDITDSFAPVIQSIEYEADVIEDSVFMARDVDFSAMLQRIGESRRKTMTLMRLLSGKADVIKMFAKRCQEEANGIGPALTSDINIANLHASKSDVGNLTGMRAKPRGDIAMYLGDIQDHLLTMYQNLSAYEKIFSRSHTNYLAQLQVESFITNNRVTDLLGKATMIGTIFVPLNVITGLFGMNVRVPGEGGSNLAWWFGIVGVLVALALTGWFFGTYWISRGTPATTLNEAAESGAASVIPSIFSRSRRMNTNKDTKSPNMFEGRSSASINSLPSRLSRYK